MTFNLQSWGRISSSSNNDVVTLQDGSLVGAPSIYTYITSADTQAVIAAAGYFDSLALQLDVGDMIYAVDSANVTALYNVSAVTATTVTIVQSTAAGDVDGPAGATDNALVRFDGATGKLIQNGIILESDTGDLTLVNSIQNASGLIGAPTYTFTGDTDTGIWRSGANTLDFSTNAFRALQLAASPALSVNYLMLTASATTNPLLLTAVGTDANIGVSVVPKGTGALQNIAGAIATPSYSFTGDLDTGLWHSAANTLDFSTNALRALQIAASPAASVNYLVVTPQATNAANAALQPLLSAAGTDAVIDVAVSGKGATGGLAVLPSSTGASGSLKYWNGAGTFFAKLQAPALAASYTLTLPLADATTAGQAIVSDAAGTLSFATVSSVTTPTTDNALARFDGVGGALQNSLAILDDVGALSGLTQLDVDNIRIDLNTISSTNAGGDILLLCDTTGVVEISSNATKAGILRFKEPVGSGTNYISFQAPALAGDTAYIYPNAFPTVSGYVLSSDTSGNMSWVSNGAASWVDQTTTPVSIVAGSSYSANNAGLVTLNMPATASFGDMFEVAGNGSGGWLLQMNAGQTVNFGSSPSTVAGSLASTNRYDCVKLVCTVANTTFSVIHSIGNLTVA